MIEFSYDPEAHAAYVKFSEGEIVRSEDLGMGVIADLGEDDRLIGVEILGVVVS